MSATMHEDGTNSPGTLADSQPLGVPLISPTPSFTPRKRLLDVRTQPQSRAKRQKRIISIAEDADDATQTEMLLNRETRWITFLYHSRHEEDTVMKKVFGEDLTATNYRYGHDKIGDLVKNFKHQTLGNVETHIGNLIRDHEELINYDSSMAKNFFTRMYNVGNFYACWKYMDGVLDIDGSSDLGKYFCKTVYFNICCELLAYMQVKNDKTKVDYARKGLLEFWDNLPTAEQFINVDRSQFKEVQARTKGQRRLKKIPDRSSMHRFRSLGSPPPPAVAPAIGSAGSGDADDVDAADDADDADGADDADDADDADGVGLSGVNTGVRVGTGAKTGAKTGAGVGIRGSKAARPRAGAASQG